MIRARHLLSIRDLAREDIEEILDTAAHMKEVGQRTVKKVPTLRGHTIVNLFFEASTRTRASFEIAGKRLSADVVNFNAKSSSLAKSESILDTAKTLDAMDPDVVVVRHQVAGVPKRIADELAAPVINAGDGAHEHPTQALLDVMTVREEKGEIAGLTVAIIGDIAHSRVARSNVYAFSKLGASVRVVGPPTMMPAVPESLGVKVFHSLREGLAGADVLMALRLQSERFAGALLPSVREYAATFGLDRAKLRFAREDAIVMHPGPVNRGVELAHDLTDHRPSVILDQVRNGVALRMAVLYLLTGNARGGARPVTRVLIRGGRVLDPANARDEHADVLLEAGRVAAVGPALEAREAEVVDARGCWVTPGFVDLHAHLRDPGLEYKEDIASGGRAAAAGGFTTVCCMANTEPVNDDPAVTAYILERAARFSPVRVLPIAAATRGLRGRVMSEMSALAEAGAVAFSDDGHTIMDSEVQRRVMEYAKMVGRPLSVHAEDCTLVCGGVVNEGAVSTRLGLPGNPAAAEAINVARDIKLAELTGVHLHVAHVSTADAVAMLREARARGLHITAEVTPHHLALTEDAALGYDTNTKMAPPLRSARDVAACAEGLRDGTLDAIATDHAPHAVFEKEVDFVEAPPGILGFETALPVVLELVRAGSLSELALVAALTCNPARVFGLRAGELSRGAPGDITLFDPARTWRYEPAAGYSKSRNSPWAGAQLTGRVIATLVNGEIVYHVDRGVAGP